MTETKSNGTSNGSAKSNARDILVCAVDELPPGSRTIVKVRNHEVGVFNVKGTYYAVQNICPHQYGPLCNGPVGGEMSCNAKTDWHFHWDRDGEIVTCPWHGLEFDLTSGKCLASKSMSVRQYPVEVVEGEVRLKVGRPT